MVSPCEMCGKTAPLSATLVEGTRMMLCPECQRFGQATSKAPEVTGRSRIVAGLEARAKREAVRDVYAEHPEMVAEDYAQRVRHAREKMALTVEELGLKINERKTTLSKVEQGEHHPSDQLVRKLERFLAIKLMETPERTTQPAGTTKISGPVTLGDLLKDGTKKQKGK